MTERTNDEWIADLAADPAGGDTRRAEALNDLGQRLERGVFYYLRNDRSDLSDYTLDVLEQMAQDFTQDALIRILDNLGSFRGESQFITWATKIATRLAISELRRARYKDYSLEHVTADGEMMPSITSLAISPEGGPPPENYAERREVLAIIDDAFNNALTERQRAALVAYTIDGVPIEEIARQMHTNRNALYKLVHDARMKLKRYMEEQGLTLDYILDLFE